MGFLPSTFDIERPNLTPMEPVYERIQNALETHDVDMSHVRLLGEQAARSMILGHNEIGGFLFEHDKHTNNYVVDSLIAQLNAEMPETITEGLAVSTHDAGISPAQSRSEHMILSVGSRNSVLQRERAAAKKITEKHFHLDGQEKPWPVWDYYHDIPILRITDRPTAAKVIEVFTDDESLLPDEITLGPVKIDKIA